MVTQDYQAKKNRAACATRFVLFLLQYFYQFEIKH